MNILQRLASWLRSPSAHRPPTPSWRPAIESLEKREVPTVGTGSLLHFDFGTGSSPAAAGYVNTPLVAYAAGQGYGWASTAHMSASDRGTADALTRDFQRGTDSTFLVDLPNGTYNVTVTLGDARYNHDGMALWAEGQAKASGLATQAGQFIRPSFQVQVQDGQLNLRIADTGGASPYFAINALDIAPAGTITQQSVTTAALNPPPHGVFLLGNPDRSVNLANLSKASVDGLAIRASWNKIETASGVYNWAYLDSQVAAAASRGKQVSISITAGTATPSWVYAAGAQRFNYTHNGAAASIPVPWDPVFLREWEKFIAALGARYGSNPAVVQVKATGINMSTPEFMLPHTAADNSHWLQVGYTRQKLENAWLSIADSWAKAFPKSRVAFIAVPNGCPPIDNSGHLFSSKTGGDWQIYSDLINAGLARYGAQFTVENHGLSDFWVCQQVTAAAGQVRTGYQMLWWVTNDGSYRMNHGTPGDPHAVLLAAVNKGIANGAHYLEIYSRDISNSNLADVIARAHTGLPQ